MSDHTTIQFNVIQVILAFLYIKKKLKFMAKNYRLFSLFPYPQYAVLSRLGHSTQRKPLRSHIFLCKTEDSISGLWETRLQISIFSYFHMKQNFISTFRIKYCFYMNLKISYSFFLSWWQDDDHLDGDFQAQYWQKFFISQLFFVIYKKQKTFSII